jgi:hypothetical protein
VSRANRDTACGDHQSGNDFFLDRNSPTIRRAVCNKTILVSGQPVKLYSLDGKTWFSTAKIYAEYKRRRAREKETFQKWFGKYR